MVETCIIYYIKNNYMFRPFSLAIFRFINEKFRKQLHLTCVGYIQWGHKRWNGYEISNVLCRMGGVGTPPILHNICEISYPLQLLPPHCIKVKCSYLLNFSFINLKMANEKGRNMQFLCNKLYIPLPPHSCVRQVYTLQSSLL